MTNEPKTKWKNKKFKHSAEKMFGSDYVDAMDDQDNVDCCEVLFDLIDRISFLGGENLPRTFAHSNRYFDDELGVSLCNTHSFLLAFRTT